MDCVLMSKHAVSVGKDLMMLFQKASSSVRSIIVRAGEGNYDILSDDEIRDLEVYILGKTQK